MIPDKYFSNMRRFAVSLLFIEMALTAGSQTVLPSAFNSDTFLSKTGSPYLVQGSLVTAAGTVLQIEAGVEIRFDAGASLTVKGKLIANGTLADSIYFVSNTGPDWQRINSNGADVELKYCHFKGGTMFLWASGGNISVTNCVIESRATGSGQDCIAVHEARRVYIDSIRLTGMGGTIAQGTKNDAIDLDDVDSCFILNSIISQFSDDGIDIGTSSKYALIAGNQVSYCNYGTSIGEYSVACIENNIYSYNDAAIQVHNHAVIYADYNTIYHNTWGIECYHSEEGDAQTGGTAYVQNTVFSNTAQTEILTQSSSSLTVSYSISDGEILPGNNNISGDPKLADPEHNDFSLQESSPCIGAGSPGPSGLRTNMGAWGGNAGAPTNTASQKNNFNILAYPNPTTGGIIIKSSGERHSQKIELYNYQGKLILTKTVTENPFLLDLSSCLPGIYILRITYGSKAGQVPIIKE